METQIKEANWGLRSVFYWITWLIALGFIFIGIRFILQPQVGAFGYGIPFHNGHDITYGLTKGIRDIYSCLVLLPFLFMRMKRAAAWVFTLAIVISATDCLIILHTNGSRDIGHLLIHGLTALMMIINSIMLFRINASVNKR
ncbi:DUF4267 domain-containing protein [Mucilaginibacter sabulilitoris]|uniref:DUF4267 domain-containing protein n=1 Tax=Mucilaginibacter sabulilitoris TaxID=1173583 RepID=A0ABZ0TM97_9SPHI|nr:DUF4267 domain-containing protein [Mucilaginibacter sabulilitoris]WPU92854.1 DUF4267 domain-containing protein [Mucilaginibacter sabulilitoris]